MPTFRLQYAWCKPGSGVIYYKRRVPLDLKPRLKKDYVVVSLKTTDPVVAAGRIRELVEQHDQEWAVLRLPTKDKNRLVAAPPVQRHAPAILTMGVCLSQYTAARPSVDGRAAPSFRMLTEYLKGDRCVTKVRRTDVNGFVAHLLTTGMSTTTVHRYLAPIKAAWSRAIRENELDIENVWARVEIPGLGQDAVGRESFTLSDYLLLDKALEAHGPDSLRSILLVLSETGARLAEIVGLAKADVHPTYIALKPHPWRPLKTAGSTRRIPLTVRAAGSLQGAISRSEGSPHVYPAYCSADGTTSDSVSRTLVSWIRSRIPGTRLGNHSLRHGMKDLLRSVQCPSEAADQILGHATPGQGAGYGEGYPLKMLHEWMVAANAKKTP